jgi:hypothetical protein
MSGVPWSDAEDAHNICPLRRANMTIHIDFNPVIIVKRVATPTGNHVGGICICELR